MRPKIIRKSFFDKPLFISGLTRSGKTMLAPIISSLERVEKVNINYQFEFIPMINIVNSLSDRVAVTIMRFFLENHVYENKIGRNINFRLNDVTSALSSKEPMEYISRLNNEDGDNVFENIHKSRRIFLLLVHDALWHCKIYFKAFPNLKMVHIERHPTDLIFSWFNKGYGSDFYDNPRNALLTINWGDNILPYYAHTWEEEYINLPEMGRIIKMVNMIQNKGEKAHRSLSAKYKKNIFFIKYNNILSNPEVAIENISKFLETKQSFHTPIAKRNARVPRKIKLDERKKKQNTIKKLSNQETYHLLLSMIDQYEKID